MPIAPVPISEAPAVPSSGDPEAVFDPMFEASLTWQKNMLRPGMNALAQDTYDNTVEAVAAKDTAVTKAAEALASATAAGLDADRLATLDALWLGALASDPAIGRAGAALVAGNSYVNTVSGLLRAYTGAAWVQGLGAIAGVLSINGLDGALSLKTVGGAALTGVGDIPLVTTTPVAVAASDINCSLGVYFTKTVAGNTTFTFSGVPPAGTAFAFALRIVHTAGTIAFPASVRVPDGTAPTLTAGRRHLFVFSTDDGGANWRMAANPNYLG